ncbi:MAG: putative beta-lysine N-acetyltransferase [Lentisphaerae bacterium]|nr:putative beta-lysine N-acetyltransferase [Lentisphaerota bacterium]MCP4102978.1 putative beta-lysine N-acetyltransferase [Lentisphaerota bacterium]
MSLSKTKVEESDIIEELDCGSILQHGKFNDRIYLIKTGKDYSVSLPDKLVQKAAQNGYSKIFGKVPINRLPEFIGAGYQIEAYIPRFYDGKTDAFMLGYYLKKERFTEANVDKLDEIRKTAVSQAKNSLNNFDSEKFKIRNCNPDDSVEMAKIYQEVFATYPFPIHKAEYIKETMEDNVNYFCVESKSDNQILAIASAEQDLSVFNAEMTDFATLPQWRGNGFAGHLLNAMEDFLFEKSIKTFYTIARAESYGMNITFAKCGYKFGGRLKNNTNISGEIESMNIWYKNFNIK